MYNTHMSSKAVPASDAKLELQEAVELIEISRVLFQKKLSEIKAKGLKTDDSAEKAKLELKAKELYVEYKKSLSVIEEYIDEVSANIIN